jgi:hypothetical protein
MQVRPTEFISAGTQHTCGADGIHLTTNSRDGRRREEEIKPNKKEADSMSFIRNVKGLTPQYQKCCRGPLSGTMGGVGAGRDRDRKEAYDVS